MAYLSDAQVRADKARTEVGIVAGNALNAAAQVHSGSGNDAIVLESAEMYLEWLLRKRAEQGASPWMRYGSDTAPPEGDVDVDVVELVKAELSAQEEPNEVLGGPTEGTEYGNTPACPKCAGDMWDNRQRKAEGSMKSTAPDYSCKDRACGGALGWPEKKKSNRTRSKPSARAQEVASGV